MSVSPNPSSQENCRRLWIQSYLDGTLMGDDLQGFEASLLQDAEYRQQFYAACQDAAYIAEVIQDGLVDSIPETDFPTAPRRLQKTWIKHSLGLMVAAVLLVIVTVDFLRTNIPSGTWTLTKDSVWASDAIAPKTGEALKKGNYHLQQGIVRFETAQGTVVTLAGPARFELVSTKELQLTTGTLSAQMGTHADPLTVRIGDMDVVDIGTAFGVHIRPDGSPTVAVFEGSVQVNAPDTSPLMLKQGDAANTTQGQWTPTVFDMQPFTELWPLTKGIDQMSHLVEFVPPGPQRPLGEYRHNEKLFLLPERMNVTFPGRLFLDLTSETTSIPLASRYTCPLEDRTVSSYSVFFNCREPKTWDQPKHIKGQITFSKPIIGVIYKDQNLQKSEKTLGLGEIQFLEEEGRGLGGGSDHRFPDTIVIGPDGRTLTFSLYTGPQMDQFRVIVAAD